MRIDTGGDLKLNASSALFVNLNGEFSNISRMYTAMAGAKLTW